MRKITVYLPADLKDALQSTARRTRRSEAEIVREGIRLVVAQTRVSPPRSGIFDSGDPLLSEHVDEVLAGFGER